VVPIGGSVLGSEFEQGLITRHVTDYLNAAGAVALVLWAWELAVERGGRATLRPARWPLWVFLAAALAALVWLHLRMDAHFDPDEPLVHNRPAFRTLHRIYLIVSTAQWAASMLLLAWTLQAWSRPRSDRLG